MLRSWRGVGRISILQAKSEKMGDLLNALDIEIGKHVSRCKTDGKRTEDQLEKEEHRLSIVKKEAEEVLMNSEQRFQDAIEDTERNSDVCKSTVRLIDSVTDYKEFIKTSTSAMKKDLYGSADEIASLPSKIVSTR